jgi:hypothetical protein
MIASVQVPDTSPAPDVLDDGAGDRLDPAPRRGDDRRRTPLACVEGRDLVGELGAAADDDEVGPVVGWPQARKAVTSEGERWRRSV